MTWGQLDSYLEKDENRSVSHTIDKEKLQKDQRSKGKKWNQASTTWKYGWIPL